MHVFQFFGNVFQTQSSLMEARVIRHDLTPEVCKTFKAELQSIARREYDPFTIS